MQLSSDGVLTCRYVLVNASTGVVTEIFSVGKANGPCMTSLSRNELLLAKDNVAVILGADGKPSRKVGNLSCMNTRVCQRSPAQHSERTVVAQLQPDITKRSIFNTDVTAAAAQMAMPSFSTCILFLVVSQRGALPTNRASNHTYPHSTCLLEKSK